jgi:hypothetical protein
LNIQIKKHYYFLVVVVLYFSNEKWMPATSVQLILAYFLLLIYFSPTKVNAISVTGATKFLFIQKKKTKFFTIIFHLTECHMSYGCFIVLFLNFTAILFFFCYHYIFFFNKKEKHVMAPWHYRHLCHFFKRKVLF